MRGRLVVSLLLATGCGFCSEPPPPPAPRTSAPPKLEGLERMQAVRPQQLRIVMTADGGSVESGQRLETYVGFSSDGLAFASGVVTSAGGHALQFLSSTTNTAEKVLPLDTDAQRKQALQALKEDGFPALEERPSIPLQLAAVVEDGAVRLTFSGAPASAPIKPFGGQAPGMLKAEVVAASPDGKQAAVRITAVSDKAPQTEFHVFGVFQ